MKNIKWPIFFFTLSACVDRINFDTPPAQFQTVVEGYISDDAGPYIVKVSKSLALDASSAQRFPIEHALVELHDDEGNAEILQETSPGVYTSGSAIHGQVGHSYSIRVETSDGKAFESTPDKINPVGGVEAIKHEFEPRITTGGRRADVFNVFVDGHAAEGSENFVRWRFTGTYKVFTHPERHQTYLQGLLKFKTPYPCSGWVVEPAIGGGNLVQREPCTCCTCWVNQFETMPQLADGSFVSDKEFRNVPIAEIPVNGATFYEKYLVQIEQMSLTKSTYNFFKLVRAQKEGASSLFQPPSGEIRGNLTAVNSNEPVIGIFWATSISSKQVYISNTELPYLLADELISEPCNEFYNHSSTDQPSFWE